MIQSCSRRKCFGGDGIVLCPMVKLCHESIHALKCIELANSLAVQWFVLGAFTALAGVQSLVGKLISHKMRKKKKKA